jgi:Mrp family chromosome partitioning ATPase/capsular polysaccharide biosynthesis protein
VIEPLTEPAHGDRWQGEPDGSWGDRPGIVASLLRYRMIVVAATLLGALVGFGLAQLLPVRYQTEARLHLTSPGDPSILGGGGDVSSSDRQVYLAKQVDIMTSRVVLERARELLNSSQPLRDLREELEVQPSANMAGISIVATRGDPRSAAALANAVGTAYQQVTAERTTQEAERAVAGLEKIRKRLQDDLDATPALPGGRQTSRQQDLTARITDLQQREQDITIQVQVYASGVDWFERAEPPPSQSQPKPKLAAALGALLGLLGAGAWAWWAAARDRRAEGRGDPGRILGATMLGEVPRLRTPQPAAGRPVTAPVLDPALEDAYHFIVASIEHELAGVGGKSIAVTSVGPGDSKTSTALQIANAASQENRKVLLIDADVRMRQLSEFVGFTRAASKGNGQGLPKPPGEPVGAKEYLYRLVVTDSGMVLPVSSNPADPWHPAPSYRAVDVRHAVRAIGDMFDLVLIDTPALLASSNALGVAGQADGVVLVISHRVSLSHLRDVRERLAFVKTPLLGYIYVRPRRFGVRALWGRVRRGQGRPAWNRKVAAKRRERS